VSALRKFAVFELQVSRRPSAQGLESNLRAFSTVYALAASQGGSVKVELRGNFIRSSGLGQVQRSRSLPSSRWHLNWPRRRSVGEPTKRVLAITKDRGPKIPGW